MALAHAGASHTHEHRLGAHLLDVAATGVTHARAQTAHQLMDDRDHRAFVRHTAFDTLGHQLFHFLLAFLEIAVAGAALHGAQRAHAAIRFVRAALIQLHFARRFLGAGKHAAHHHAIGAGDDGLCEIARIAHAAVRDHRYALRRKHFGSIGDGGDLRHAYPARDTCGAGRAGADADLYRVDAGLDQRERAFGRRDVAADHLHLGKILFDPAHAVEHTLRMAVRGVDHDHNNHNHHQHHHTHNKTLAGTNNHTDTQPHENVFAGVGLLARFLNVLD